MASSELEFDPDIKKAPPHVEGELLKQNTKSIMGFKNWKKFYFIVLKDKLQYFDKREDSKQNKDPVAFIRMSQVTSITEVVFNGVPRKHHLNCGFSLEAFHPISQQLITLNLLAETPEDMRYWVHALRYIKAYWAKMTIRETVLSEEQERKILETILSQDGDSDLIPGNYSLDEDGGGVTTATDEGSAVSIYFADGSKVKLHLSPTEMTSDLLEREEVKDHLSSSAARVWLVDSLGNDMVLGFEDRPGLFPGKMQKLFALDHAHRVLPIFYNKKDFECVVVSIMATANQIIEHHDISVQLDLSGVTNRGLFLKSDTEELMFTGAECPCDVLFDTNEEGLPIVRLPVGKLVIHNKALGGGRSVYNTTKRLKNKRITIYKPTFRKISEENRILEEISEEEQAQSNALDMLLRKKKVIPVIAEVDEDSIKSPISQTELEINGEQWVNMTNKAKESSPDSPSLRDRVLDDARGPEDALMVGGPVPTRKGSSPVGSTYSELRNRSHAISDVQPIKSRGQSASYKLSSPNLSPSNSPGRVRSRSKSPKRKLPDAPTQEKAPLQRHGATRGGSVSKQNITTKSSSPSPPSHRTKPSVDFVVKHNKPTSFQSLTGKGPTILFSDQTVVSSGEVSSSVLNTASPPRVNLTAPRLRSPTVRGTIVGENFNMDLNDSRSSAFGLTPSVLPGSTEFSSTSGSTSLSAAKVSQVEPPTSTLATSSEINSDHRPVPTSQGEGSPEMLRPFIIDFKALQLMRSPEEEEEEERKEESTSTKPLPINVTSPNLLKIILLQSSEASDFTEETRPMDFISLSGVSLSNRRGVWSIEEGCNFHDELPFNCDDHTETFRLAGGVRALYNHTHKRWHVLPPRQLTSTPLGDDDNSSVGDGTEHAQDTHEHADGRTQLSSNTLYLSKKVIVTEVGSAFHDIVNLFGKTRDNVEKKRIGSDMTNPSMGHMIRGRFCSAVARLMLDGLRPYRLQGIIQDDIWKVTTAFCAAAQLDPTSSLVTPAIDKLIFQPIHALRAEMKDNNTKFRTFISLAMSKGMLTGWLEALPKQKSVLHKFYLPSGFLCLVNEGGPYNQLYQEMLLTLEPMLYLPFDLSIDFESRHFRGPEGRVGGRANGGAAESATKGESSLSGSDSSSSVQAPPPPSQNSLRPNVVIKTHAATGQRTSSGNIINAIWDTSPLHNHGNAMTTSSSPDNQVDGRGTDTKVLHDANKDLPSQHIPAKSHDRSRDQLPVTAPPPTAGGGGGGSIKKLRGSLFKKFSDSLQQLNMGGAITGAPRTSGVVEQVKRDPTPKPHPIIKPMPATGERKVEALHTNVCDDNDELCFSKGDLLIVKEQINSEWLICSLGNKTGIVPVNYIKSVITTPTHHTENF